MMTNDPELGVLRKRLNVAVERLDKWGVLHLVDVVESMVKLDIERSKQGVSNVPDGQVRIVLFDPLTEEVKDRSEPMNYATAKLTLKLYRERTVPDPDLCWCMYIEPLDRE